MTSVQDVKELCEMISNIKTNAEASKVYKEKCVELADYIDNLSDSFHLLQSSSTFLSDRGVQRALAVLRKALQKCSMFMESCGKALMDSSIFSKGPDAVQELEEEVQKGLSLLSLALNVHNARKTAQLLELTAIRSNYSESHSKMSVLQNAFAQPFSGESSPKIVAGDPFHDSSQKTVAEPPSILGESSQKEMAGPSCFPCGSSKDGVAEPSGTLGKSSQAASAGQSFKVGGRLQKALFGPSHDVGEISQNALGWPSGALVAHSQEMGSHSQEMDSPPVVSTSLSTSTPLAHQIPATSFSIIWDDHPEYWETKACGESKFDEVRYLKKVCWLDVGVKLDCSTLEPGTYTVTWRYQVTCQDDCWEHVPVNFQYRIVEGDESRVLLSRSMYLCPKFAAKYNKDVTFTVCTNQEEPVYLCSKDTPWKKKGTRALLESEDIFKNVWIECASGFNFTVEEGEKKTLEFKLFETSGHWKKGLALDALFITPCLL